MMKGKDLAIFVFWIVVGGFLNLFYDFDITQSDVITFLSIIIGFQVTSLSILFNSKILNRLFEAPDALYRTELHRLSSYYKFSIGFESLCTVALLLMHKITITLFNYSVIFNKNNVLPSVLFGTLYCMFKVAKDLFAIFELPRNE